jgi:hypothetical protein
MSPLENLQAIRKHVATMRPKECCQGATMKENGKEPYKVCSMDCQWQKLDLLIANAIVDEVAF